MLQVRAVLPVHPYISLYLPISPYISPMQDKLAGQLGSAAAVAAAGEVNEWQLTRFCQALILTLILTLTQTLTLTLTLYLTRSTTTAR